VTASRPALHPVPGPGHIGPEARRERFEKQHGQEVAIVPPGNTVRGDRWLAIVPAGKIPRNPTGTTLGAWFLEDLMDQLDAIYPPEGGQGLPIRATLAPSASRA
jgi:hypothetical protein